MIHTLILKMGLGGSVLGPISTAVPRVPRQVLLLRLLFRCCEDMLFMGDERSQLFSALVENHKNGYELSYINARCKGRQQRTMCGGSATYIVNNRNGKQESKNAQSQPFFLERNLVSCSHMYDDDSNEEVADIECSELGFIGIEPSGGCEAL